MFDGGTLTLGFDRKITLPAIALGIQFVVDAVGKVGDPTVVREVIPSGSRKCFVLTGTIFNPEKFLKAVSDCN